MSATCATDRGVSGVYCLLCSEPHHYFDTSRAGCRPCTRELARVVLFMLVLVLLLVGVLVVGRRMTRRNILNLGIRWHSVVFAARKMSLQTKAKICISYYQIVVQIDRVYAIVYPPGACHTRTCPYPHPSGSPPCGLSVDCPLLPNVAAYAKVVATLNSIFHIFFGWIPGVATACTGLGLAHELYILCLVPLVIIVAAFGLVAVRRGPATDTLPFALVVSFLCYPFVASRGFRALAPCDCFPYVDGREASCFIRDAYSIQCVRLSSGAYAAPPEVRLAAWLAIGLYAISVPLVYGSLLLGSRQPLSGRSAPTVLSRAMRFLR